MNPACDHLRQRDGCRPERTYDFLCEGLADELISVMYPNVSGRASIAIFGDGSNVGSGVVNRMVLLLGRTAYGSAGRES